MFKGKGIGCHLSEGEGSRNSLTCLESTRVGLLPWGTGEEMGTCRRGQVKRWCIDLGR